MLYGSGTACRDDSVCPGGVCYFGSCVGLLIVDQRWMQEVITERVDRATREHAALRARVVQHLRRVLERADTDLAYRARTLPALEALGGAEALEAIAGAHGSPDDRLAGAAALSLTRLGRHEGVVRVRAMTEDVEPAIAAEALRALGSGGRAAGLDALLATLNPDLEPLLLRAALDGLADLADPRSTRPLVDFLERAPSYLHHRTVRTLRAVTGQRLPGRVAAWRGWMVEEPPPHPPPHRLRRWAPEEDLGLPPP